MNPVYDGFQGWLTKGNASVKFWTLLILCIVVYIGMIAGITFGPKKKPGSEQYDPASMIGWAIMVIILVLVTWIMILMNPHGIDLTVNNNTTAGDTPPPNAKVFGVVTGEPITTGTT